VPGNLPASEVEWVAATEVDQDRNRTLFPVDKRKFKGDHTIPPRPEMLFGTPAIGLKDVLSVRDKGETCYFGALFDIEMIMISAATPDFSPIRLPADYRLRP
jgi:hypothetical protein